MAIRSLIGDVVLNPGQKRGEVHATLRGELMAILDFATGRNTPGTLPSRAITGVGGSPRNQTNTLKTLRNYKPPPGGFFAFWAPGSHWGPSGERTILDGVGIRWTHGCDRLVQLRP